MTAIFDDVLLADETDGDVLTVEVRDGVQGALPKEALGLEDALGMVAQGSMPEVPHVGLRGVEPIVDGDVVYG